MGIRWQLIICFIAFVLAMLLIIWVFLIALLDFFYERTKINEFNAACDAIEATVNTDVFEDTCYNMAVKYNVCIRVFFCQGTSLRKQIASVDASQYCLIHHISEEALTGYYKNALDRDGGWVTRITLGAPRGDSEDRRGDRHGEEEDRSVFTPKVMAIAVHSFRASDGNEYAVFLNTEFTPMFSMTHTLNNLFLWIALAMLLTASLLAYIFSLRISRPLARMNDAAKQLAAGKYDTEFKPAGYRETRELAGTLNYAAQEISKSDRLQRELIANISHDLRTPLTMIGGYAEIMRDIPSEMSPENVQVIIDESQRLTDLVNDMLDLSKIRAGTKIPEKSVFDLTDTVREVMQRYSVLVAYDGYQIIFRSEDDISVDADRTMMLQVIYNLINNAVNYIGPDKTVCVEQTVRDDRVRITVTDHGEGIPPQEIANIWDRYYKVDRVHRRARIGTGLGLSIVRNILQLHGASFGVESRLGSGSSFWFELPVAGKLEREPPADSAPSSDN